jgi:hypothetical protein
MKCVRCGQDKKSDRPICWSCTQHFARVKQARHAFSHVARPTERKLRRQKVTLSSVKWESTK